MLPGFTVILPICLNTVFQIVNQNVSVCVHMAVSNIRIKLYVLYEGKCYTLEAGLELVVPRVTPDIRTCVCNSVANNMEQFNFVNVLIFASRSTP